MHSPSCPRYPDPPVGVKSEDLRCTCKLESAGIKAASEMDAQTLFTFNAGRSSLLAEVRKMVEGKRGKASSDPAGQAYNQACDDILSALDAME